MSRSADAMADGRSPFETSFLVEHQVTLNEVYDLSDSLALAARLYLLLANEKRHQPKLAELLAEMALQGSL